MKSKINKKKLKIKNKINFPSVVSFFKNKQKVIQKGISIISDNFLTFLQGPFIEFVKKILAILLKIKHVFISISQVVVGTLYSFYISISETYRLRRYQFELEKKEHKIISDIIRYSKRIIYYLVIFIALSFFLEWSFLRLLPILKKIPFLTNNLSLPTRQSIEISLEIFIGAVSGVLGLIFALYTVGVQMTNERYSEKVSDFINQESVSDYFFSFLIFTDLYALLILLKLHLFIILPVVSFIIASVFVALSFLGILIFKTHYVNSLKPLNLFRSLWRLCNEQIEQATNPQSYKYKSWSLAIHSRNNTNNYLDTFRDLFKDLVRNDNWSDASYAPIILGGILRDYIDVKKFVDKEKGWWFFERYEQVKADDLNLFTIKANYELQGKGPLHIPKAAEYWLEDKIIESFDEFVTYISTDRSNKLALRISEGYKQFLVGDYKLQRGKNPKLIPGAIQNQEFKTFQKALKGFLSMWTLIDFSKTSIATEFLNNYFAIVEGLMDKWEIDTALKIAESFYDGDQLNHDNKFRYKKDLPTYTRDILINYWERLEVEQKLENKIITPNEFFLKEIKKVLVDKRKEIIIENLTSLFDNSDQIIVQLYKQKKFEYVGHFIKMQYEWISRLLHLGDKEIAEKFSQRVTKNVSFVAYLPRQVVIDLELLEQAEKGFFVSLTQKAKLLFEMYAKLAVLVLIIVRDQENNQDRLFRLMKLPVIWGGITFLFSELEQEPFYITALTSSLEKSFRPGWMVEILEKVADLQLTRNIWWETTRYHSWYATILNHMRNRLSRRPYRGIGEIGFAEQYDHPSVFIQQLAELDLVAEEKCVEGFLDWLRNREKEKKKEEIKKLINLLIHQVKKYEQK